MKKAHKLYRDEWCEYPDESEEIACDPDGELNDPRVEKDWDEVTCKRCLRVRAIGSEKE